jgi:hypothetical protein
MKLGEAIPNYQAYRNELQDKKTSIYKQYKKQRKRLSVPMMKNGYKRQQSLSFHIRKQLMILTSMRMFLTRLGSSGVQQQIQKTTKHLLTLRQDLVQQSAR